MKNNRRDFLLKTGAAIVALPLLTNAAQSGAVEETDDFFNGMYDREVWDCMQPKKMEESWFFTARQFADDPFPRIVKTVYVKEPGKKTIQFIYLEPSAEPYPETEDE